VGRNLHYYVRLSIQKTLCLGMSSMRKLDPCWEMKTNKLHRPKSGRCCLGVGVEGALINVPAW
jgi:hypothetical protein